MIQVTTRLLLASLLAAPLSALALDDGYRTPAVTADQVRTREGTPDALLVVDVRPNGEYRSGHVAGAVNLPYDRIGEHLDDLSEATGIALYCTLGHRTKAAEQTLLAEGVRNLYHLEGGLMAWRANGYPVHTGWAP